MRPAPDAPAHRLPIRVYFEDTDAGGMAYHASHLRWAERARTEAMRAIGLDHRTMIERHNSILVVRRIEVEYALPARLDDLLTVETRILAVRGATMEVDQRVLREDGAALAALRVGLASVERTSLRPRRLPDSLRAALGEVLRASTDEGDGSGAAASGAA
jgi:acyl-CoA thioester hydrolase